MCTMFRKRCCAINNGPVDLWWLLRILVMILIVAFLTGFIVGLMA